MFNLFFEPDDLYIPLAQIAFSTTAEGKSYAIEFKTKYPGRHAVDVILTNPVELRQSYGEAFAVAITDFSE